MSRSIWKGKYVCPSILSAIKAKPFIIKTYKRNSTLLKEFLGLYFKVYSGKRWFKVFVTEKNLGHKLGEFSFTRKLSRNIHIIVKRKKKNKKK